MPTKKHEVTKRERRVVFMPRELRTMTWQHVKRLQDSSAADDRYFRCECCGADRELLEATMCSNNERLPVPRERRYRTEGQNLIVCFRCAGIDMEERNDAEE